MERVQTQFLICRTGGCSFGSVGLIFAHVARFWDVGPALAPYWAHVQPFYGYFVVCVGLCWARVGTILGLSWAILGYVGTFWPMLAPYWAHVGPFCAIFGCVSAFVLDLGISMSLNFRPRKAFAQNTQNTRKKYNLWTALLMVFAAIFFVFVSFLGHAAVRLCLPDLGLMLGHCGLCRHHIGLMLGHFVVFCGLRLPLLSHFRGILWFVLAFVGQELGPYWAYLGPFWTMLGHFGQRWHRIGLC